MKKFFVEIKRRFKLVLVELKDVFKAIKEFYGVPDLPIERLFTRSLANDTDVYIYTYTYGYTYTHTYTNFYLVCS